MAENKKPIPDTAVMSLDLVIDRDKWRELENQGWTQSDIEKAIAQALSSLNMDAIIQTRAPVESVINARVEKYY